MEQKHSLDELERASYMPFTTPLETPFENVVLKSGNLSQARDIPSQSLDGTWKLCADGYTDERLNEAVGWPDAFNAEVPNSIHTNLFQAGLLEDPLFAKNDKRARENSYRVWWYKKEFDADPQLQNPTLRFDGICYRAMIWLNGKYLGMHSGMFGGPDYPVADVLREHNTLIVKILNAPSNPFAYSDNADYDEGWKFGTVINCVYGWHYACLPSRGIWKSVHIDSTPKTVTEKPFFAPVSTDGTVDLILRTGGAKASGRITVNIYPKNFAGDSGCFEVPFTKEDDGDKTLHYRFKIENPRLWWPNGHGKANLYAADVTFAPDNDIPTHCSTSFGIRTVEMGPLPDGPREDTLNFTYIINGKPIFVKGSNWCTTDALLRFPDDRYDRFLTLIQKQHVQLLRAWGGGMPESDYFYDKCDELGIMVRQEWPTCWDSDRTQSEWELADTVARNVKRIRNHPSLVTYAGGNESVQAESPAMTRMARLCYELDGTRTFYKTSPYGGALHSYITYWDRNEIDASLRLSAPFIGEFGMASAPNLRSVYRYLPEDERREWPPREKGSFYYHMPRFNECPGAIDIDFIGKRIHEFTRAETMEEWIIASQMAQATVIRHLLEKMRSQWPYSVGVCYYKTTDVYPACSWATIDYYGVPKMSYYVVKDAYEPIHAALIFQSVDVHAGDRLPVFYFDDNGETAGKDVKIQVAAYGEKLSRIAFREYDACGKTGFSSRVGDFAVTEEMERSRPLFITAEVLLDGKMCDRTFYWLNYKEQSGCIFDCPQASVKCTVSGSTVRLENTGSVPAVGLSVECPSCDETFEVSDSVLWLNPGEATELTVNTPDGLTVKAWNMKEKECRMD